MSYIIDHFSVLESQEQYVRSLTSGLNAATHKLFCHVLVSTLLRIYRHEDSPYSPISSVLIERRLRGAKWRALQSRDLIEATAYSIVEHRSREYRAKDWVLDAFFKLDNLTAQEYMKAAKRDLFTGRRTQGVSKSALYDANRNPEPELIRMAMDEIKRTIFNLSAVEAHVANLLEAVEAHGREAGKANDELRRVEARWRNDHLNFRTILRQNPAQLTKDLWQYAPAYFVASTGRLIHKCGGLQSGSKLMKEAAYRGVPGLRNYDLRDSQISALIQELVKAGLNPKWLIDYLATPNNKEVYAARAGLSPGCFKTCLIALVMGARLPQTAKGAHRRRGKIIRELKSETGGCQDRIAQLLAGFTEIVRPLHAELEKWHEWLLTCYIPSVKTLSRGGWYITNRAGKKLCVSKLTHKSHEAKSKVSAFILQGQESAFIHHLTALGPKYGFETIANEHDGLVVIGSIPSAAVVEAGRKSGLARPDLIEKPFVRRESASNEPQYQPHRSTVDTAAMLHAQTGWLRDPAACRT